MFVFWWLILIKHKTNNKRLDCLYIYIYKGCTNGTLCNTFSISTTESITVIDIKGYIITSKITNKNKSSTTCVYRNYILRIYIYIYILIHINFYYTITVLLCKVGELTQQKTVIVNLYKHIVYTSIIKQYLMLYNYII